LFVVYTTISDIVTQHLVPEECKSRDEQLKYLRKVICLLRTSRKKYVCVVQEFRTTCEDHCLDERQDAVVDKLYLNAGRWFEDTVFVLDERLSRFRVRGVISAIRMGMATDCAMQNAFKKKPSDTGNWSDDDDRHDPDTKHAQRARPFHGVNFKQMVSINHGTWEEHLKRKRLWRMIIRYIDSRQRVRKNSNKHTELRKAQVALQNDDDDEWSDEWSDDDEWSDEWSDDDRDTHLERKKRFEAATKAMVQMQKAIPNVFKKKSTADADSDISDISDLPDKPKFVHDF